LKRSLEDRNNLLLIDYSISLKRKNDISSGVEYDPKVIIKVFLMEQGKPNGLLFGEPSAQPSAADYGVACLAEGKDGGPLVLRPGEG